MNLKTEQITHTDNTRLNVFQDECRKVDAVSMRRKNLCAGS